MRISIGHTMVFAILTVTGLLLANTGLAGPQDKNQKRSTRNCGGCGSKEPKKTAGGAKGRQSQGGGAGGKGRSPTPANACVPGCCARDVTTHIEVPPDVSKKIVTDTWDEVIGDSKLGGGPDLDDCPLHVLILDGQNPNASLFKAQYAFTGKLAVQQSGDRYTFTMDLVDLNHGDVVQSGQTSWRVPAFTQGGYDSKLMMERITALAETFMPLDDVIHEYEGMPRKAELKPEKDPIGAGKRMTIHLNNMRANTKKGDPQQWQRVVVKVKKGKLTNGTRQADGTWVFPVGRGEVRLEYKAPVECKRKQTETVTVYNSCNVCSGLNWYQPEQEIATTEFDVMCIRGEFEFQYESKLESSWGVTVNDGYEHSVPFSVNFDEDPPAIEGEGEYSTVLTAKKGTLGGRSPVTMSESPDGPRVYQAGPLRIAVPGVNASAIGKYTSEGFRETNRWTDKKVLSGELIESKTGEEKLKMEFEQTSGSGGPPSRCGPWVFPLQDGYKREFPREMSVGGATIKSTFTITLHLETD